MVNGSDKTVIKWQFSFIFVVVERENSLMASTSVVLRFATCHSKRKIEGKNECSWKENERKCREYMFNEHILNANLLPSITVTITNART